MATSWRIDSTKEETVNDSDKIFTVPTDTEWEILWVWVKYTSSSVVGTRQLEFQLQNSGSDVIAQIQTGITQGENNICNYLLSSGIPDTIAFRNVSYLLTPVMGNTFLSAGQKMRIWDNNAVDAAGDDMNVYIQYGYRTV